MTKTNRPRRPAWAWLPALAAALLLTPPAAAPRAEEVLRVVPSEDLRGLDPTYTTADATQTVSYLIYEMLFSLDQDLVPRPQMVESHTASADSLTWEFVLRPGLRFHDGSPVTSADVVASLRRWGTRAVDGRILTARLAGLEALDERRFTIRLKQPYGLLLLSLANPASLMPVVMRERDAAGDPAKPVTSGIGSGPFVFDAKAWVPGSTWQVHRNQDYVPRPEPASGMAGGRVVKLDRIEFHWLPDQATAVSALRRGEMDLVQSIPYDLLPLLRGDPGIAVADVDPFGFQAFMRPNALFPPFDKPEGRQALLYAAAPEEYLAAALGETALQKTCVSPFMCAPGAPAPRHFAAPDPARLRGLLAQAGYRGQRLVVLAPSDLPELNGFATVLAQRLRDAGAEVDLQAMDFAAMAGRRASMDDPAASRNGWSLFVSWRPRLSANQPITNGYLSTSCDRKNFFGWPCDERLEALRLGYLDAVTPEQQAASMQAIADRFFDVLPYVPVVNFSRPFAHRSSVSGLLKAPVLVFWNVEKR